MLSTVYTDLDSLSLSQIPFQIYGGFVVGIIVQIKHKNNIYGPDQLNVQKLI